MLRRAEHEAVSSGVQIGGRMDWDCPQGYQLIRLPKSAVGAESSRDRSLYDMLGTWPHVKAVAQVGEFEARSDLPSHSEKGSRR